MKLNFRGSGTGYLSVLLAFAALLFSSATMLLLAGPGLPTSPLTGTASSLAAIDQPTLNRSSSPPPPSLRSLDQLPMRFEPNRGQADPQVKFLARGAGYGLVLTADQTVLSLGFRRKNAVVRMHLAGASPAAPVLGTDRLPGSSNYFVGSIPARWHRDIPQFGRVRYQSVYPGVDLVYYGNQGQLEYDFEVSPGANPREIAFEFQGSHKPELDKNGDLILALGSDDVKLKAPRIYQSQGTERQPVAGQFVVRRDGKVGFKIAAYDRRRALIIDPVLTYSTFFGGSVNEACSVITGVVPPASGCPAIAIDSSSNIYLAGSTTSVDFPLTPQPSSPPPAAFQGAPSTVPDVFVTKLNSAGNAILFSTYLGGDGADISAGVAVDSAFNVVVAGTTTSSNFPVSSSAFQPAKANAGAHAFVSELDATGHTLNYSTYLSGGGTESARGLAVDSRNKIYVIGATTSTEQPDATHSFPATLGAIQTASRGTSQFFISKIDPALIGFPSLVYSTYFGGGSPANGVTVGGGIAVDANSNVYITGGTNFQHTGTATTDFPILNAYQGCLDTPPTSTTASCVTSVSATDAFLAKINPSAASGSQLVYSTYLGGTGDDAGYGVAVDSGLSAYVTGSTTSNDFIIPTGTTPFQAANGGSVDAFVAKLGNPCTGSTCTTTTVPLNYFTYLGGTAADAGLSIAADTAQGAHVAGWTASGNFPHLNNPVQATLGGSFDGFVARIDTTAASATALGHYSTYLGGTLGDFATSIAVDAQGNTYVAGETASGNFPNANPFQAGLNGGSDVFVSKLGPAIALVVTETVSPNPAGAGNNVTFTYKITNNGDLTTGIIFTDSLPASGATFVSANSSPGQTSCPASGATVTCTVGTLNGGASATVTVVLTSSQAGTLSDGGRVTVFGTNVVVTPSGTPAAATINDFTVSVSPATANILAGIPASFTVTVTPSGNIPESVTLSASGAPSGGTVTFPNGASFTNLSSGPQSRQLVINTTARVTTPASLFPSGQPFYAALFPVSGLALLGFGLGGTSSRRRRLLLTVLLGAFFSLIVFQAGCGSKTSTSTTTGTPAGTYNLTVTATSGSFTKTQQVVLTVQ